MIAADGPLARLGTMTLFDDPRVRVTSVGARAVPGGFTIDRRRRSRRLQISAAARCGFGERHGAREAPLELAGSSSIATRTCSSVSRSRSVTVRSSSVW